MSVADARHRKRSVVPRWRSFLNTPSVELVTTNRFPDIAPLTSAHFNDMVKIWLRDQKPEDFADIMDAGIASGSRFLAVKGARQLLTFGDRIRDRVKERAETILFGRTHYVATSDLPLDESVRGEVIAKIGRLKRVVLESPRNALTHVEMARLYCRLAQFEQAERHLRLALAVAPDDRFVLRSCTRFFTMLDEGVVALGILRNSTSLRYDPWVQSAELAAAELEGKQTRFADKAAKRVFGLPTIGREHSELASGWISRTQGRGFGGRHALRLLARTLQSPTENALAQGVWLIDSTEGDFAARFPNVRPSADAHEAKSILLAEKGHFAEARAEAANWFVDQPFQARACINLVFLSFVHLRDYEGARSAAEAGLLIHSDDWMLLNLAVLANVYTKRFDRANEHIQTFSRLAEDDEQQAFLYAARGMLALETGKFDEGLAQYSKAISLSRAAKHPELVVNAAIFMIEVAARRGFVSPSEFSELKSHIEKTIASLPPAMRKDASQLWDSRRTEITERLDQFDFSVDQLLSPKIVEDALQLK